METNTHESPEFDLTGENQSTQAKGQGTGKFKLCVTGVGLGLLAVFVTIPIWGILGPAFISALSPLLATVFSIVIPVAAFSIVLRKICSTPSNDTNTKNEKKKP